MIKPHKAKLCFSLCRDSSAFTYSQPDTKHARFLCLPFFLFPLYHFHRATFIQRLLLLLPCWEYPLLFLTVCDIKWSRRREGCSEWGSVSAVRQASVTVSTPVCCGGIHTWQINPCALSAAHSAHVKSSAPCRDWGDILERQPHCGKPFHSETRREEAMASGRSNEFGDLKTRRKSGDNTGRLMKGKRRDTNKAANETDASTCCDLFLFI